MILFRLLLKLTIHDMIDLMKIYIDFMKRCLHFNPHWYSRNIYSTHISYTREHTTLTQLFHS